MTCRLGDLGFGRWVHWPRSSPAAGPSGWSSLGWIVGVLALSPLGAKLADVTKDDTESFLPAGAESTEVQRLLKDRFPGGETRAA